MARADRFQARAQLRIMDGVAWGAAHVMGNRNEEERDRLHRIAFPWGEPRTILTLEMRDGADDGE